MIRRTICALGLVLALALLPAGGAVAAKGGAGTETFTSHELEPFGFPVENECTGTKGFLLLAPSNQVFHITKQADGNAWVTGTSEGTATFTPSGGGAEFSGHFTSWFGEALNNHNHVEHSTTTIVLSGPEGSRVVLHFTSHVSTNGSGTPTVDFEKEHAHLKCA
jgi:hypothetical protein